jgi:hypothetical protein
MTYLLAPYVTTADAHDRAQVDGLVATAQEVTGKTVDIGYFDRGYTGQDAAAATLTHGIRLVVVYSAVCPGSSRVTATLLSPMLSSA